MITVESGIPFPDLSKESRHIYPWAAMEVGDSFLVKNKAIGSIRSAISNRSKRNPGERYTCRAQDGGIRVWRIA